MSQRKNKPVTPKNVPLMGIRNPENWAKRRLTKAVGAPKIRSSSWDFDFPVKTYIDPSIMKRP